MKDLRPSDDPYQQFSNVYAAPSLLSLTIYSVRLPILHLYSQLQSRTIWTYSLNSARSSRVLPSWRSIDVGRSYHAMDSTAGRMTYRPRQILPTRDARRRWRNTLDILRSRRNRIPTLESCLGWTLTRNKGTPNSGYFLSKDSIREIWVDPFSADSSLPRFVDFRVMNSSLWCNFLYVSSSSLDPLPDIWFFTSAPFHRPERMKQT